ncbi:unnamed protein product [Effrenium voratum]|nr:unnamed protein product [Effrenium voratum]
MSDAESEESSESGEQPPAVSAAPYEKISCLGEGAFGAVWLARCKSSGRHVALKEVSRQLADPALLVPERDLLRQVAEAREQGSWVSPALTGLVAAFTSAFAVSLAMDLVEGGNLLEHLKAEGRMPAFRVERYGAEIASALKWLHGAGWLYRDLKLSNVMLSLSEESLGRVKLIDYGFAFRGLEASQAVGTLQTMAPEVICCARAAWKEELQLDFLPSSALVWKLRAAIESIELDQEALRVSSPLFSLKTFLATSSAATVSMVASLLSSSPTLFILMPSLTTVIFLYSSLSESAAARYKANAKYNYGQNSKLAATAETSLAIAESRKVFFPFGVGLTAITAAACVTLRIFNEKIGDFIPEGQSFSTILAGDNVVLILFALASMVGATLTSLTYDVSTRAALVLDESIQASAQSDWEATRLPKRAKEPTPEERKGTSSSPR